MGDHIEHTCRYCGSYLHYEDACSSREARAALSQPIEPMKPQDPRHTYQATIELLRALPKCACGARADRAVTILSPFATYNVCRRHDTLNAGGVSTDLPWAEKAAELERLLGEKTSDPT